MTKGISVLGAGMVGAAHAAAYRAYLPRYQHDGDDAGEAPELRTVCDARGDAAKTVAQRYGFAAWALDWRSVIEDPRTSVVSVALPNALHEEVVLAALRAGKHVLCEKPLALSAASARRLREAADMAVPTSVPEQVPAAVPVSTSEVATEARADGRAKTVVAATVFNYRRMPAVAEAIQRVRDGDIGAPVELHIAYRSAYAADPQLPFGWRYQQDASGGGASLDLGTHAMDLALALCGPVSEVVGAMESITVAERSLPLEAASGHARGALGEERRAVETDDVTSALLRFANGCHGAFTASRVAVGYGNDLSFTLSGTEGTIRFESARPNGYQLARRRTAGAAPFETVEIGASSPYVGTHLPVPHDGVTVGYAEALGFVIADFLDAVFTGKPLQHGTLLDGLRAAEVLEAIQASARGGRPVVVPDAVAVSAPAPASPAERTAPSPGALSRAASDEPPNEPETEPPTRRTARG